MPRSMLEVLIKQCNSTLSKAEGAENNIDRYVYFTALAEILSDAVNTARQSADFARQKVTEEVMRNGQEDET